MATPDVLLEIRRATRPYGVAGADDFRLTPRQLQWAHRTGVLACPHPGVYVDPALPRSPLQDLAVAVKAGGRLASAWGRSAGALCDIVDVHPPVPEIVVPRQRHARVDGAVVHRSSDLCSEHVMLHKGIRVTKPLITALDLGVVLTPMDLADVLVRARQRNLFEPAGVQTMLRRLAKCGRTGIRTTRAALELVMIGDRPADSILELRFHHGPGRQLPPYEYQWEVRIAGRTYYIDFAYPSVMIAIEVDGYETRIAREALLRQTKRQNAIVLAGWQVLRFTWEQVVFDPSGVAAQITAALGAAGYNFCR